VHVLAQPALARLRDCCLHSGLLYAILMHTHTLSQAIIEAVLQCSVRKGGRVVKVGRTNNLMGGMCGGAGYPE